MGAKERREGEGEEVKTPLVKKQEAYRSLKNSKRYIFMFLHL